MDSLPPVNMEFTENSISKGDQDIEIPASLLKAKPIQPKAAPVKKSEEKKPRKKREPKKKEKKSKKRKVIEWSSSEAESENSSEEEKRRSKKKKSKQKKTNPYDEADMSLFQALKKATSSVTDFQDGGNNLLLGVTLLGLLGNQLLSKTRPSDE